MDEAEFVVGPESGTPAEELPALYEAVGWSACTDSPGLLLAGASYVPTARRGGRLVGLARALSDGATVRYLQDVLVTRPNKRRGSAAPWWARCWTATARSGGRSC